MQKQLQKLLETEMTRREFLATLGFGAATLMGFSGLIKALTTRTLSSPSIPVRHGYGGSPYGR